MAVRRKVDQEAGSAAVESVLAGADDRVLPGAGAEDEDSHPPRLPAVT